MSDFLKERNEAMASGDKDKILKYCKKYGITIPEDEEIFWMGVHKAICNLYSYGNNISKKQYEESLNWLTSRGYDTSIK